MAAFLEPVKNISDLPEFDNHGLNVSLFGYNRKKISCRIYLWILITFPLNILSPTVYSNASPSRLFNRDLPRGDS